MVMRLALFLLLTFGALGLGGIGWVALRPPPAPPAPLVELAPPPAEPVPPPVPKTSVLVAARPLRVGALLAAEDLGTRQFDAADLPANARPATPEARSDLLGGMVRRRVEAGEILQGEDVLRPRDRGFLAAVLAPGMRAISVGVDMVSGAAGLIWPGDRVDLVLTQTLDGASLPAGHRISGETILTGLRVIAIDQKILQGAAAGEANERAASTVTLEVTAGQAERIAVASRLGRLSLLVHSAADPPDADAKEVQGGVTWGGDVSPALQAEKDKGDKSEVLRIYRGPDKTEEVRF